MQTCTHAVIDPIATGHNIRSLRQERGLSVKDLQHYFHFDEPRAIYKWQAGQSLPSIDNLYALSALFDVPMDSIIIGVKRRNEYIDSQDLSCESFLCAPAPAAPFPSAGTGMDACAVAVQPANPRRESRGLRGRDSRNMRLLPPPDAYHCLRRYSIASWSSGTTRITAWANRVSPSLEKYICCEILRQFPSDSRL